jgi:hypothetical protein
LFAKPTLDISGGMVDLDLKLRIVNLLTALSETNLPPGIISKILDKITELRQSDPSVILGTLSDKFLVALPVESIDKMRSDVLKSIYNDK